MLPSRLQPLRTANLTASLLGIGLRTRGDRRWPSGPRWLDAYARSPVRGKGRGQQAVVSPLCHGPPLHSSRSPPRGARGSRADRSRAEGATWPRSTPENRQGGRVCAPTGLPRTSVASPSDDAQEGPAGVRTQSTRRTRRGVIDGLSSVPCRKSRYVRASPRAVALQTYGAVRVKTRSIAQISPPQGIRSGTPREPRCGFSTG
jgi:hypothetical protein